jgi:hypothetical protein
MNTEAVPLPKNAKTLAKAVGYEIVQAGDENLVVVLARTRRGNSLKKVFVSEIRGPVTKLRVAMCQYVARAFETVPRLANFVLSYSSAMKLVEYLYRRRTKSEKTLYIYGYNLSRFCNAVHKTPDELVAECLSPQGYPDPLKLREAAKRIDSFAGELEADGAAPCTLASYRYSLKTFYMVNEIYLQLPKIGSNRVVYRDRSPTPEELSKLLEVADLRGKVIVSMLALGGFREGTLVRLKYGHVKDDLEKGTNPVHVHVEAEITKGKYADYDTFVGKEAVEYLKLYLDQRRLGTEKIPPEDITEESPLIRANSRVVQPLSAEQVYDIVHELYRKVGLVSKKVGARYQLRPHSIRKFFRTQLTALGVPTDYIEYMMGHKLSTYHDVNMKGIEFLRNIYAASGLSIRPKTRVGRIEILKEIVRGMGLNPEEVLSKETLAKPWRTYASPVEREEEQVKVLSQSLKEMLRKELLDPDRTRQ